jgi:2-oxo-4-hydroxy-4-carboxy--5-ureidoimidazoline (OHCU) decarboxylase
MPAAREPALPPKPARAAEPALPPELPLPPVESLNGLSANRFAAAVGPLFEHAPAFLARLAAARPFADESALWSAALRIARAMPEADQVELINAHPRLGALPASVSAFSFREQGYGSAEAQAQAAGADRVAAELERLNAAYEARFGFHYCIFVNGRSRDELIPGMASALQADRPSEIDRALGDIVAIARSRAVSPAG